MSLDPQPRARRRRASRTLVRAVVLACVVIIGAPASAIGVWMIRQYTLRQKLLAEGFPLAAPVNRQLAEARKRYVLADNSQLRADYFAALIWQLQYAHRPGMTVDELLFYLGEPQLMGRTYSAVSYLYEVKRANFRTELLVTMNPDVPRAVLSMDVRNVDISGKSGGPPFPRDGFVPYRAGTVTTRAR